ncbi:MAG TPA: alpha-amylase family glycosyl hydrolase, partial [Acidimicrobiales bacterium]|nr:alpha-amylase family glycosyl hydrolase [Acidimicrobiales bacterium]
MITRWWQQAVTYEIYVPSFARGRPADEGARFLPFGAADAQRLSGHQAGDLAGIRDRLEYLEWLGVEAVWLTPFYPSPLADFGYDVADYCDVNPAFGTLADYDALVEEAHRRGIRVVVDWVPNHTSDQHPWFAESRSSRRAPRRDWYIWRDGDPDQPPNNWKATFVDAPAWTWDEGTGAWYLHLFLPRQPDLNWANPEVESAMTDVLRFWLDRGTDGFRIDVVHGLGKDPDLPDAPVATEQVPWSAQNDYESTH